YIFANSTAAEVTGTDVIDLTANGWDVVIADSEFNLSGVTYIYMTVRAE
ncbi:unnamed protein product, partial [marine sediment metagenome]